MLRIKHERITSPTDGQNQRIDYKEQMNSPEGIQSSMPSRKETNKPQRPSSASILKTRFLAQNEPIAVNKLESFNSEKEDEVPKSVRFHVKENTAKNQSGVQKKKRPMSAAVKI